MIVSGVAISANQGGEKTDLAKRVEAAMAQAVTDAITAGVTDDNEIRKRMLHARDLTVYEHPGSF